MSEWTQEEFRRTTLRRKEGFFVIVLEKTSESPLWFMRLFDYDGACGAVGKFRSKKQALNHYDRFMVLAREAYNAKHAKYGMMPVIMPDRSGRLVMVIEGD